MPRSTIDRKTKRYSDDGGIATKEMLDAVEQFFERFLQQIERAPQSRMPFQVSVGIAQSNSSVVKKTVLWKFPSKNPYEMRRWAQLFCVLDHIHAALVSDTVLTKRDIYYRNPSLFKSQRVVDAMVNRICNMLSCTRAALNVSASPRSVVSGPIYFALTNGSCVETEFSGTSEEPDQLIPDPAIVRHVVCQAQWALIVEKHAVYQTLRSCRFLDQAISYGIEKKGALITGKGYPDHAVRWLFDYILSIPNFHVFMLFDADIQRIYYEALSDDAYSTRVHWIGLKVSQWMQVTNHTSLQPLSCADRRKATRLLRHPTLSKELRYDNIFLTTDKSFLLSCMLAIKVKSRFYAAPTAVQIDQRLAGSWLSLCIIMCVQY